MEYTVLKLGKLAGVSTRTLRYYDEIGLLTPGRITESGYRVYGEKEIDKLQQILFFRELDMSLADIKTLLTSPSFDRLQALNSHLSALKQRRKRLDGLIANVEKTILHEKGSVKMSDKEKFEAFKKDMIRENEEKYGEEIRQKYGDKKVDESNARMMKLTPEQYEKMQSLSAAIVSGLEEAVLNKEDPAGEAGQRLAKMHREFLSFTWKEYSKEAHMGLAQMYLDDARFTAYYDKNVKGCAAFLRDAVAAYVKE
jgi:DNA-binding transcriptional MerR regulator